MTHQRRVFVHLRGNSFDSNFGACVSQLAEKSVLLTDSKKEPVKYESVNKDVVDMEARNYSESLIVKVFGIYI